MHKRKETFPSIDRQVVYNRHSKEEKNTECSRYILANLQMHKRKKKKFHQIDPKIAFNSHLGPRYYSNKETQSQCSWS